MLILLLPGAQALSHEAHKENFINDYYLYAPGWLAKCFGSFRPPASLVSAWFEANLLLDKRRQESISGLPAHPHSSSYLYNNNSISASLTHLCAAQNINTERRRKSRNTFVPSFAGEAKEDLEKFQPPEQHKPKWKIFRKLQKEFSCHYAN